MTTRKLHAVRTPLCLAVGLSLGLLANEAGAAPSLFQDAFVRRISKSNNDIVWSTFDFCDTTEFPPVCRVSRKPADLPASFPRTVFDNRFGLPGDDLVGGGEIAADGTHVYWQNIDGAIMRHVVATSTGAAELVALKQSAASFGD